MKKFFTLSLIFCILLTCTPTTTFAAESQGENERCVDSLVDEIGIVPYNVDVWSTNNLVTYIPENGMTIQVRPGQGKNLKVHFYLSKLFLAKMDFYVLLSTSSGYKTIAHWNTEGHHWADVVTNTTSSTYTIRLVGPAYINGAFYTEP